MLCPFDPVAVVAANDEALEITVIPSASRARVFFI
jgi:hypothetical protein